MTSPSVHAAARDWAMRLQDPAFADWERFTDWLSQDPAHNAAYEAALAEDARIAALVAAVPPQAPAPPRVEPAPQRGWGRNWGRNWGWGGAVAAAVLLSVLGYETVLRDAAPQAIETAAGERRSIALADGTQVALNGGTRILVDADTPREVTLDRGEALFDVRHDDADPFVVLAGPARLVDAGTVFNVVREARATRVEVAEGAVIYNPGRDGLRLDPGMTLAARDGERRALVASVDARAVGSWRVGRLVYSDAPLDRVAADLARSLGAEVRLGSGLDARRFTGTIALEADAERALARIAPLLGARAERSGSGWILIPVNGA